jgi:hypothetical protein
MQRKKLLVVACPRSGTLHTAHLLNKAGVKVKHENMGQDGTVSCFFAPTFASHMQTPESGKPHVEDGELPQNFEFEHVWLQVRDPLKVIASLLKIMQQKTWDWVAAVNPKIDTTPHRTRETSIRRAMMFWIEWNKMVLEQRNPELVYRVEDFDSTWPRMCELLGIEAELPVVSQTMHASSGNRKATPVTFEELVDVDVLMAKRLAAEARKLGYNY